MPTITFDLPEGALSALRLSPTEFVKEMRVAAAFLWYSHGELSQSKAAEIAGTSRAEFIDELAHRRIPVVQVTAKELQDEIHPEGGVEEGGGGEEKGRTGGTGVEWAARYRVTDIAITTSIKHWDLGLGESQVIAHCVGASKWAVLDDRAARRCAVAHNVSVIGTLG